MGGAKLDGGDGKDSGADANVEDGVARFDQLFQRFQARVGGGMVAGAEGQAGVKGDYHVARLLFVLDPRRLDDQIFADSQQREVFFPGIPPVLIGAQGGNLQLAQFGDAGGQLDAHLDMGEALAGQTGQVRAQHGVFTRPGLDAQSVAVTLEQVRDGFDVLERDGDAEFVPGHQAWTTVRGTFR